jgi:peptide deformylase
MSDDIISFNTEQQVKRQLSGLEHEPYPLVHESDTILSQIMPEWDFEKPPMNATELASRLVETCKLHRGYGLSANQCGLPYRVFVMGYDKEYVAFFNPSIVLASKKETHMAEGCLSFPFLGLYITRPQEIAVTYQDYTGEWKQATFDGISARCFQHELDHMNGIVYTKKVKPMALQSGMQKRNKIMKKLNLR